MKGFQSLVRIGLAALLLAISPVRAETPLPSTDTAFLANPAIWTVHGHGGSLAYVFGSIHLVPANLDWHSDPVMHAMQRADSFVFEVQLNDATEHAVAAYIQDHGTLAPGMSLREMLSPQAKLDYDAALAQTGLRLQDIDSMRPWMASITLDMTDMMRRNYQPGGVDKQIFSWAARTGKRLLAFENVDDQLKMLAPSGPKLEMEGFELELHDLKNASKTVGPLVDAWAHGDVATIERITLQEMKNYPHVQKAIFTDRNQMWVNKIGKLLSVPRTYFICVGAAHLVGPNGVPALLRKAGYQVDGP